MINPVDLSLYPNNLHFENEIISFSEKIAGNESGM